MKKILLLISFGLMALIVNADPVDEGKALFVSRCASCHNVNKTLTGPALAGVHERRNMDWIVSFVRSSKTLIQSGDKDAVALYQQFNQIPMPDHQDLSAENVKSIVEYIKSATVAKTEEEAPFARPGKRRPDYTPVSITDYGFFLGYLALVSLLVAVLVFAVQLKQYERLVRKTGTKP